MAREQTYWNGEPTPCLRGIGVFPDGSRGPVVEVTYGGQVFHLDDTNDRAWRKVVYGFGSPRYGHQNVEVITFIPNPPGAARCIECETGKHTNCTNEAMTEAGDIVACPCATNNHGGA